MPRTDAYRLCLAPATGLGIALTEQRHLVCRRFGEARAARSRRLSQSPVPVPAMRPAPDKHFQGGRR